MLKILVDHRNIKEIDHANINENFEHQNKVNTRGVSFDNEDF